MQHILFNAVTITKNTNQTSLSIPLDDRFTAHGIQYMISGSGVLTLDVLVSGDGANYVANAVASEASGLLETSGPGSDGKDILSVALKPAEFAQLKVTETGTAADAVLTAYWIQK